MNKRLPSLDVDAVLAGWPAREPPADFVDRVMDAVAAPPVPVAAPVRRRASRRPWLLAAALVAAAASLVMLARPGEKPSVAQVWSADLDLGVRD